jgi:hypothetical protein
MQKVEVCEHAVNNTAGDDLAKLLWLKSPSSEVQPLSPAGALLSLAYPLLTGWMHSTLLSGLTADYNKK